MACRRLSGLVRFVEHRYVCDLADNRFSTRMARHLAIRRLRSEDCGPWGIVPMVHTQLMRLQGKFSPSHSPFPMNTQLQNSTHDHTIPGLNIPIGPLKDQCDQGTLWDPTLSAYYYKFDANSKVFTAYDPSYPTAWLNFLGRWGDQQYPRSDPRQRQLIPGVDATSRYVSGPTGPIDKQLNRAKVCIEYNDFPCVVRPILGP